MRGGSAKSGDVDVAWQLSKINDTTFKLHAHDQRFRLMPEERTLTLHRRSEPLRHDVDPQGGRAAWDADVADHIRTLDEIGAPDDIGRRAARQLLTEHWKGTGRKPGSDALLGRVTAIRRSRTGAGTSC
jgi:hypothetical protein